MDARQRLLVALENKEEPDRVPSFVEGMMAGFRQAAIERFEDDIQEEDVLLVEGDWTLYKFYQFDGVWLHQVPIRYKSLNIQEEVQASLEGEERVDRFGRLHRKNRYGQFKYQSGFLNSMESWERWIDEGYFDIEIDESWITRWESAYPKMIDQGLVPIPVTTCFEPIREAFSFGRFSYFYRKKMDFLKKLARNITKNLLEIAKGWCDAGFEIVTWADDCAYKGRVMFPPAVFHDLIEPIYTKLNAYCHKRSVLTFFHSDGFTEPFFEGLIRSGFDGIQSLEPAAGMDLAHLKEAYGNEVCLIGNLDCSELLPFGKPADVIAATKRCLRVAAKGGGYILGPTTDITDACKPENIKVMMDTLLKHGVYNRQGF